MQHSASTADSRWSKRVRPVHRTVFSPRSAKEFWRSSTNHRHSNRDTNCCDRLFRFSDHCRWLFSANKKTGRFYSVGRLILRLPPVIQLYVRILVSCRRLPIFKCGTLNFCNAPFACIQPRSPLYIRQDVARNIPDAVYIGNINRFWSGQNAVRQKICKTCR